MNTVEASHEYNQGMIKVFRLKQTTQKSFIHETKHESVYHVLVFVYVTAGEEMAVNCC